MSQRIAQRILEHLAHDAYQPSTIGALLRDLHVEDDEQREYSNTIDELASSGRIDIGADDRIRLPGMSDEVIGTFKLNQRGFGFIVPDHPLREGDLFVPAGSTGGAVSGDRVRAQTVRRSSSRGGGRRGGGSERAGSGSQQPRSELIGRVVEVIERGQATFVGALIKRGRDWMIEPDGRTLHDPVLVRDPHSKFPAGRAVEGHKVAFEVLRYPEDGVIGEGAITRVLGEAGRPDVETQGVIVAHDLRTEFPEGAIRQAQAASRTFEAESRGPWKNREDLTGEFIFTIDPPDAKDFDDAISIEYNKGRDEWTLGVHIADVTHFVPPGSALDEEAKERGTSVYLPRLVIPMLPEALSNGVCSLQEGVNRFTKSAFITFDGDGTVISQRVASTVIRSAKRLTYLEAQALIDGDEVEAKRHGRTETPYTKDLLEALRLSDRLAKILQQRRLKDGMIVLNLPQVELVFDDDGHVIDAVPEDDAFTHKIIEMFMVEANEAVARLFAGLHVPVLRRIHPEPAHGDITELRQFALSVKYKLPEHPTRRDLQQFLDFTRHTPAGRAVHLAVLRTLSKAVYDPGLVGHFALASDHYAHFTSPIRRYPDLSLHRALQAYLDLTENGRQAPGLDRGNQRKELAKKLAKDDRVPDEEELVVLGRHCSEREVAAEEAERELRTFLVLQFLSEQHMGDDFPAIVTGFSPGGVYVSIDRFLIDGKVAMQDIGLPSTDVDGGEARKGGRGDDGKPWGRGVPSKPWERGGRPVGSSTRADRWMLQTGGTRLVAQRSGAWIGLGDSVTVRILRIDLASRHMDLGIVGLPKRAPASPGSAGGDGEGGGSEFDRPWKRKGERRMSEKQRKQQERLFQKRERKQKERRRKGGFRRSGR